MGRKHAILSASSSDRWLHCPPSARLCENYEDKGSDYKISEVHIELYTDLKDLSVESAVEAVLDSHGIFYQKSEVWIESERLYEVLYTFEMEV